MQTSPPKRRNIVALAEEMAAYGRICWKQKDTQEGWGCRLDMEVQDGITLIERIATNNNLWKAYAKVKENKGAPGVDGITVNALKGHMKRYLEV